MNLLTHLHDLRHMVFISNQISSHTKKKKNNKSGFYSEESDLPSGVVKTVSTNSNQ